jgi:hypothetical protein
MVMGGKEVQPSIIVSVSIGLYVCISLTGFFCLFLSMSPFHSDCGVLIFVLLSLVLVAQLKLEKFSKKKEFIN